MIRKCGLEALIRRDRARHRMRAVKRWLRLVLCITVSAACAGGLAGLPAFAASVPLASTCQSLVSQPSSDPSSQVFTATASIAAGEAVEGYTFNFGDNQTYSYYFGAAGSQDRSHATVSHAYDRPGSYNTSVIVQVNGRHTSSPVSSSNCTAQVAIGNQPSAATEGLVNTGPGSAVTLFFGATIAGCASFYGRWIYRQRYAKV